jgi:hypothetical protein
MEDANKPRGSNATPHQPAPPDEHRFRSEAVTQHGEIAPEPPSPETLAGQQRAAKITPNAPQEQELKRLLGANAEAKTQASTIEPQPPSEEELHRLPGKSK